MELIRDCLDKQVVDAHARPMGRVDGIVIDIRADKQPQVAFIEIGGVTRWRRISRLLEGLSRRVNRSLKIGLDQPDRIPWSNVVTTGIEVIVGVEAESQPALRFEIWLRKHLINHIPGA